jgi:uroporphyrinogen decarboxylase
MDKMTTRERLLRIYRHEEADRVPILDYAWKGTIKRWHREGLPENISFIDYFDLDRVAGLTVDITPQYDARILEETAEYTVYTTEWGVTQKEFKYDDSTPEFIDFTIINPDRWLEAKKRMQPSGDRIPWKYLKSNYKKWKEGGYWINADLFFGFDAVHSWVVGTERFLIALIEYPDWCVDMFNHFLHMDLAMLEMIWEAGYEFDCITWCDDMGYKNHQFFSVDMYRELLKPVHKRAIEWAHRKGIKAQLHSCGDINPMLPELIDIGLDALNPLEVKAGMDPIRIKRKYGKDLVLHGGLNSILWSDWDMIAEEMRRLIPVMKESGGYIFSSDHSIPNSVSFDTFTKIIRLAKELGSY